MPIERSRCPNDQIKDPNAIEGNVYAWGKIARLLTEPSYLTVKNELDSEELIAVDLCSSFPIFRAIMDGRHNQLMHTDARKIVGKFVNNFQRNKTKPFGELDIETHAFLCKILPEKHSVTRELITAPIFELMARPPGLKQRNVDFLSAYISEKLTTSDIIHKTITEPSGDALRKDGSTLQKGAWTFIKPTHSETTLKQILEPTLKDKTGYFIEKLGLHFAQELASDNKLRRVNFISLDIEPLEELIKNAENGFPPKMRNTLFFKSAKTRRGHMRADLKHICFKENGIAFFSSIEGWPYYGDVFTPDENINIAKRISSQLTPGGKAVFFPWSMQSDNHESSNQLSMIEDEWIKSGLSLERQNFLPEDLISKMGDRELVLANHSPILKQAEVLQCLILSKPKR